MGVLHGRARKRAERNCQLLEADFPRSRILTLIAQEEEPNQRSPVVFARPPVIRRALERRQPLCKRRSSIYRKPEIVRKFLLQPLRKPRLLLHSNVRSTERAMSYTVSIPFNGTRTRKTNEPTRSESQLEPHSPHPHPHVPPISSAPLHLYPPRSHQPTYPQPPP
jgi:hypothetical protein